MQKIIKQKYLIKALIGKVWQALIDEKEINKWGGGPAKMSEKEGGRFELWGGDIYGTNTKVVKNKELFQDWFSGKWDKSSKLKIFLKERAGGTELDLAHEDVPPEEFGSISEGWKDYYMGPMKEYLENNK
jgi:activator of HSP90 ATPase